MHWGWILVLDTVVDVWLNENGVMSGIIGKTGSGSLGR